MQPNHKILNWTLSVLLGCLQIGSVLAAARENNQTLSPYFQVIGEHLNGSETLPLQKTSVQVDIVGVIADVNIK